MKLRFGSDSRHSLTGTDLAARMVQILALLPLIYLVLASAWPSILIRRTVFSRLFDLGVSAVPRAVSLPLSALYRLSGSEMLFSLLLGGLSLAYGIVMNRLLQGTRALAARRVLAALIALDLLARLLPLRFAALFGWPVTILAALIQLLRLGLVLLDLRKIKET